MPRFACLIDLPRIASRRLVAALACAFGSPGDAAFGQVPAAPVTGRPQVGRRDVESPVNNPLDDRLLPDAARSPWRTWFSRNYLRYEPAPLERGAGREQLPPHLVDTTLRDHRKALYRDDVSTRLTLLLRDGDDRVRGAAALSLARGGFLETPDHVARLFSLLDDEQKRVREQSLIAAGIAEPGAARHRLLSIANSNFDGLHLQNEVERTRMRALASLSLALQGEPLLPALVGGYARDPSAPLQLRALVVQALGLSGSDAALPLLESLARNDDEAPLIRATATAALGLLGQTAAVPLLLELLVDRDSDTDIRAAAALAIGEAAPRGDDTLVRELVKAIDHESNALVGRFLLLSIGQIGGTTARLRLEHALQHESAEQRVFAELGLGLLARQGDAELAVQALEDALRKTRSQDEQAALLCALGLSRCAATFDSVANFIDHGAPEIRRAAVAGLSLLRAPRAVALLEQRLLDDPAPEVRLHAARALARLDPTCASLLVRELGSGRNRSSPERSALILALGYTGDPLALEPLLDLLREPGHTSRDRESATFALGLIYDIRRPPVASRLSAGRSFLHESTELAALIGLLD